MHIFSLKSWPLGYKTYGWDFVEISRLLEHFTWYDKQIWSIIICQTVLKHWCSYVFRRKARTNLAVAVWFKVSNLITNTTFLYYNVVLKIIPIFRLIGLSKFFLSHPNLGAVIMVRKYTVYCDIRIKYLITSICYELLDLN